MFLAISGSCAVQAAAHYPHAKRNVVGVALWLLLVVKNPTLPLSFVSTVPTVPSSFINQRMMDGLNPPSVRPH